MRPKRTVRRFPAVLATAGILLAVSACTGASPSASPAASAAASSATPASSAASGTPTPTASTTASPTSTPGTPNSDSFAILPGQQPADFVSKITCSGTIGASDPVAVVQLHAAVENTGNVVLRDYANPGSPRSACSFGTSQNPNVQLIDARHVVIDGQAVVDLPEVRFHWFQLPGTSTSNATFVAVSPGLGTVVWLSSDYVNATDQVHLTTSSGDQVVATLPALRGRCGSPDDSMLGAYTNSGSHLYVLDQPSFTDNSLIVLQGQQKVLSILPPNGGWPQGAWPAMAVWSPTSETLFYRLKGDVWRWTPTAGAQRYLPGVSWSHPTISPDGGHLAYAVVRPDGLHNVFLIDLAHGGSPKLIGKGARNQPVFLNSTQLWYRSEGQTGCTGGSPGGPLIYNVRDASESASLIDQVFAVWPSTSSTY